jgi:hypothetical protein
LQQSDEHSEGCHVSTVGICDCPPGYAGSGEASFPPIYLPPMLIGLQGLAGSGKSTAARYLTMNHRFERAPFAQTLKRMLVTLGVPHEIVDGDNTAKAQPLDVLNGKSLRHAAQTLGTEWGRNCMGEDFWVNTWARRIEGVPRVVADDVRFPNEVGKIKALGGFVIRLVRPGAGVIGNEKHASENVVNLPYDYTITNDGDVAALHRNLRWVVDQIEAQDRMII